MNEHNTSNPSHDPDRIEALANLPRHTLPGEALDAVHARIDELGDAAIMRINRWATSIAAAILIVCSLVLVRELSPVQQADSAEPSLESVAMMSPDAGADTPAETRLAQWIVVELHDQPREHTHD